MFWPTRMETALEGHSGAWFISSWWEPFDYASFPREIRLWLDTHGQRIDRRAFDGLTVYQYDMRPGRLGMARFPIVDTWTDQVAVYAPHGASAWGDPDANASALVTIPKEYENDALNYLEMSLDYTVGVEAPSPDAQLVAQGEKESLWVTISDAAVPIRVLNRGGEAVVLSGKTIASTAAFSALAMHQDISSDIWRPVCAYYGQPNMRARVDTDTPEGELSICLPLSNGEYDIHLRVYRGGKAEDRPRARVALGGEGLVQTDSVDTAVVPEGETEGWAWVRVGTVRSIANELCFQVRTSLSDGQQKAIVDFERAMITPAGVSPDIVSFEMEVAARGTMVETLRPAISTNTRRVDIETLDPYGTVRMVSIPVNGEAILEGNAP